MGTAESTSISSRLWFWLHFLLVILAWIGPFVFDWYLMVIAYSVVLLQFVVFNRCLMNAKHQLSELEDHKTFYAELLELVGIRIPRKQLKYFVRSWLYVFLGSVAVVLQVYGDYTPPLSLNL